MNAPLRVMGRPRHYVEWLALIRARVAELGITHETLDAVAGLQSGYASKLLSEPPVKRAGAVSRYLLNGALGLMDVVYEDAEALALVRSRLTKRVAARRMPAAPGITVLMPDYMRQIGYRGHEMRMLKVSPSKRKRFARKAAQARWKRRKGVQ